MSIIQGSDRILCPVSGCPEALTSSSRHFRNFASIRNHLNDHCTCQLSGAIPVKFLNHHNFSQCSVCDKIIAKRFHGTCPKCRPIARTQAQMNSMRSRATTPNINNPTAQCSTSAQQVVSLPSLSTVHKTYVRTIRNIPMSLICYTWY